MSPQSTSRLSAPPPTVWRSWPLRDERAATWVVLAVILAATLCTTAITDNAWLGSCAGLAVLAALWRHFVPVEYHLGTRGLRQTILRHPRMIHWNQMKVIEIRRHGVLLYPDRYFGPLRAMRGLYVPWGNQRDELLQLIDFYATSVVVVAVEHPRTALDAMMKPTPNPTQLAETDEHLAPTLPPDPEGSTERRVEVRARK